ncbi:UNVERIFIED_ORG: pantothenate synthetase [Idiomarina abyssalis]|jgi:pantoate--beta-alanine ligase|uniref:Pantothenate synthetase n=1 Tax=Idiomarina loihiensis (strain ATCC BAA-735 / DSM 15497 / L2-TR) TaxID=283942 RepID=PANC_IDILO|nr:MULTISPECIES: pantoate--beta-alanine ligase [Idiomarina]Q5QVR4.1 RecName: Full=Pantothenate synthetase; Short=PS; AltName: Full=Pantoate--beta-alanine ligase; AltName: Full=Pantoate-activating enzyme [Idiomarina loihiensis L2TR]NWO03304.1 pantoate--beta-alanine ligase [Idiomarinaceae bacterium]AAV83087.1 Panthothenate synthetase [Idiomarina loihiensis L2TR]AGM37132.1 panthothenate synthetase [Idiomarina loihiensis GSL 199]TDO51817.1 pantothenate synthetase [Idiomarina sp. 017G]
MRILKSLAELRRWRQQQSEVALVPTMGNLHDGHLQLVKTALERCDNVVVSIFVNPMQFGANEDLDSYPRTLEADCQALDALGVSAVFTPQVNDVYPRGLDKQTRIEVPGISDILCGASRPGHFTGVATIVCKLFNMVQPQLAVFGEKDYQQLQVIRLMVQDLSLPVEVLGTATQRETSGLAMSSRNGYLSTEQKHQAAELYKTLEETKAKLSVNTDFGELEAAAKEKLTQAGFVPDYFSIRNAADLQEATPEDHEWVILAAAFMGKTRLIDNLRVTNAAAK